MSKTQLFHMIRRALRSATAAESQGIPANEAADWAEEQRSILTINRREFIKKSAMGLAGVAAMSLLPSMRRAPGAEPRIVIVGAGMAGLYCAHRLKAKGISKNVMIYEASNRTGGRMFTQRLNGNTGTTELGGEFVDGDHTFIRELAAEFGVKELDRSTDKLEAELFLMDGSRYQEHQFVEAFQAIRKQVGRDSKAKGEIRLDLDNLPLSAYLDGLEAEKWFKTALGVAYLGEYGLELEEQSALNFVDLVGKQKKGTFSMFGESDERYKLLGGNQQLCDRMAEGLKDQIILDAPLVGVESAGKAFRLMFKGMKQAVDADIVVMTVPYTVLRDIPGIDKLEGMTPQKLNCIRTLGAGQNGKFFLDMQRRVWREQQHQGYLYTPNIHTSWDSYHLQNENAGKSIYSIFFGGKTGASIAKGGAEAYIPQIDAAFPGFKDAYSGFNFQMNWWVHPWAKGSYICPRPGQYNALGANIATPVGNMIFAGEHTSVDYGGFMNGAAETGFKAAERIEALLKA